MKNWLLIGVFFVFFSVVTVGCKNMTAEEIQENLETEEGLDNILNLTGMPTLVPTSTSVQTLTPTAHVHKWSTATCMKAKTCSVCGATEGSAKGHTYDFDTDLDCNVCGYVRGYWSDWTDGGTVQIAETSTRQVETRAVTVTVTQYRYSRSVWYNSSGVYSLSRRPPDGYTLGTPEAGSKTYRWDYTPWLDSAISPVYVESWKCDKYEYNGTAYYTEETQDVDTNETHWFYRDVKYY